MMFHHSLNAGALAMTLSLALTVSASPISRALTRRGELTVAQLETIAPTSNTCDGAPFAEECITATDALPHILNSFKQYNVDSPGEQAALLSIMAFETGDFKYNKNHYPAPGTPGKGTRNMQSPEYNAKYFASIPDLSNGVSAASLSPADLLTKLLSDEDVDFGSAAWFLTSQCTADVRSALKAGTEAGLQSYLTQCVGTTVTEERTAYWTRALSALNGSE